MKIKVSHIKCHVNISSISQRSAPQPPNPPLSNNHQISSTCMFCGKFILVEIQWVHLSGWDDFSVNIFSVFSLFRGWVDPSLKKIKDALYLVHIKLPSTRTQTHTSGSAIISRLTGCNHYINKIDLNWMLCAKLGWNLRIRFS